MDNPWLNIPQPISTHPLWNYHDTVFHIRLHLATRLPTNVPVHWRPPQTDLHYPELYVGIYDYLRRPPDRRMVSRAVRYLRALKKCYHPINTLQRDRIRWTQAWLDALEDPENSEAETVLGVDDYHL